MAELNTIVAFLAASAAIFLSFFFGLTRPKDETIDEIEYLPTPPPPLPEPPPPMPEPTEINYGKWPDLVKALIRVESGGLDTAIGDKNLVNKAYGPLQIRKPYTDDVNRVFGTKLTPQQMFDRQLSIDTFYKYMSIYATSKRLGFSPTYEIVARIHNGGPLGYKNPRTAPYWAKVKAVL